MKKIEVFKLTDGTIVEDEQEAIEKQKEIDLRKGLFDFFDPIMYRDMDSGDLVDSILENKDEFLGLADLVQRVVKTKDFD